MANNKKYHYSLETEQAILGCAILNHSLNGIYGYISVEDFFDKRHQIIYQALAELSDATFDDSIEITILLQRLREKQLLEAAGGEQYLASLASAATIPSALNSHIATLIEKSRLRKLADEIDSISGKLISGKTSADKLIEQVESSLLSLSHSEEQGGFEPIQKISDYAINVINERLDETVPSGISSGFKDLDYLTGGFQPSDLIIIAARPSMGKTALALNIAANVAENNNKTVAFFSVEMSADQIAKRILSMRCFIDAKRLRDPRMLDHKDRNKLLGAKEKLAKLKLFIDETPGIRLGDLIWRAKNLHKKTPLSVIIIDYLQLITLDGKVGVENRQLEVAKISQNLKRLARELKVPVIALAQLSRRVEQRESKIPMMSDLRESGAIEQDADLVSFIYREDYYKNQKDKSFESIQKTELIIGKHRNGPTGTVELAFDPRYGQFSDRPEGAFKNERSE